MQRRNVSLLLFGEGKADAVFLSHLAATLIGRKRGVTWRVSYGQGGSPQQVIQRMIKKELYSATFDDCLLLLDSDRPVTQAAYRLLEEHKITLVSSAPHCLEGLLLTILDDPPTGMGRQQARNWKKRFQQQYLKTDRESEALRRMIDKCPQLFPVDLIQARCAVCPPLRELVRFLSVYS